MRKIKYNKLVRDKIPGMIAIKGKALKSHTAIGNEYLIKAAEKLVEEAEEVQQAVIKFNLIRLDKNMTDKEFDSFKTACIEELADLRAVEDVLKNYIDVCEETIDLYKKKKERENGGFDSKIILDWVEK